MRWSDWQTDTELRIAHFPEARLSRPDRLGTGSKSRVAHHQFAVVKRWANQDRPKIIFADSGQLASQGPACEMML